jgi:hypothetical protein
MTFVSNDPIWWTLISGNQLFAYSAAAIFTAIVYDWVLKFGQEFELIWRQRWSLMTLLYVGVRYLGILYAVIYLLWDFPFSMTDEA